jgi:osmotically-inducible protein OsmY
VVILNQEAIILSAAMNRIRFMGLIALVASGAVACATGPRKTEAERQVDRETADRVQLALNDDQEIYARHISVRADGSVVSLSGYVWSQPDLEEALRVAQSVPGVTQVVDQLELQRNGVDNSPVSR